MNDLDDLYTSQVHLKRLLAGQATPAFTRPPEDVLKMLDPAFFPGLGALTEDEYGRLQCPVRGCGKHFLYLAPHIARKHQKVGGVRAIREALSIPTKVSLLSKQERDRRRVFTAPALAKAKGAPNSAAGRFIAGDGRGGAHGVAISGASIYSNRSKSSQHTIHRANWTNTCPAQLTRVIEELRDKLGRSPSINDFEAAHGRSGLLKAVMATFGTWNNAKAMVGLELLQGHTGTRTGVALVVESLRAWYEAHGDLPTTGDTKNLARAPMIPSERTIRRAFGVSNWPAAMRSAADHLGIKSERYGTPQRRTA